MPLTELPAAPLPLAEPPEQLPEVPADVPGAPPAALPHIARRYVSRRAVCGRAAGGATGTSATAAGTSSSARQVVVVPRVVQLMAPGVVERGSSIMGVVVPRVGSSLVPRPTSQLRMEYITAYASSGSGVLLYKFLSSCTGML